MGIQSQFYVSNESTHPSLSGNSIGRLGVKTLANALKHNSALTDLEYVNVCDAVLQAFTLTPCSMSNNSIDDAGATALAEALKSNSALQHLEYAGEGRLHKISCFIC